MARARHHGSNQTPVGLAPKIVGTLFLGCFLAAGLFFFGLLSRELWKTYQTYQWPSVTCRILESEVVRESGRDESPYVFQVRYEYDYEGQSHTSERAWRDSSRFDSYDKGQDLLLRFPAGSTATAWVNPSDPSEAVLLRGHFWMAFFLIVPSIFILVGGVGIWAVWHYSSAGKRVQEEHRPLSSKASSAKSTGCLVLFFGVFLLVGAVTFFGFFVRPAWKILQARSWVEVPCHVESSEIQRHRSDDGTTYRVDILYRYRYEGVDYKSSRYHFMGGASSGYEGKQRVVRQYPAGSEAVCYVNPQRPQEAVLERGWIATMWFGLIPLAFVGVGVGGFVFAWRKSRQGGARIGAVPVRRGVRSQSGRGEQAAIAGNLSGAAVPAASVASHGPVELKPRHSPMTKMAGVLFIAIFWNGIVAVFLYQVIRGWVKGGGFMEKWFLPVFLIPFVLIGLGLIGAVFHQFLGLFNARPRLRVNTQQLALGEELEVEWRLRGRTGSLEKWEIAVEAREEATYRRGTDTRTDQHTFAKFTLVETSVRGEMASGMTRFRIPSGTMHSFQAPNNKITWQIKVRGTVRRWPDISEEFPLIVLPGKLSTTNPPVTT